MRGTFLRGIALVVAAAAACVPSSQDDKAARGAGGARIVPTATASGTPFTTSDGWTVTIERIALVALVDATTRDYGGGRRFLIWDGTRESSTYVPSLPVGQLAIMANPQGLLIDAEEVDPDLQTAIAASNLTPDVQALIFGAPDNANGTRAGYPSGYGQVVGGPAVMFAARATKEGRTVRTALSLASAYQDSSADGVFAPGLALVDVVQNDVRFAEYELHPERIFAASSDDASLVFAPIARADRDGDGVITGPELAAVLLPVSFDAGDLGDGADVDPSLLAPGCSPSASYDSYVCLTLLDRIADNAQHIIVLTTPSP